jgi:hypothetical protein
MEIMKFASALPQVLRPQKAQRSDYYITTSVTGVVIVALGVYDLEVTYGRLPFSVA